MATNSLGVMLTLEKQSDKGLALFDQAIALAPDDADARMDMEDTLTDQGALEAVRTHYEAVLQLTPYHGVALRQYAFLPTRALPTTQIICIAGVNHRHCEERSNLELHDGLRDKEIASFLAMTVVAVLLSIQVLCVNDRRRPIRY